MSKWSLLAIPFLALSAFMAACGGGDDKTVDIPGGGEVSVSDELPDSFPDDFPRPDGAKVIGSITGGSDGQEGSAVTLETDDSSDDVEAFYEEELNGDGPWKQTTSSDTGAFGSFFAEKDDMGAGVFISEVDGKTTILITYGTKDDLGIGEGSDSGDDGSDSGDDGSDSGDDGSDSGDSGDDGSDSGDSGDSGGPAAQLPDEVDVDDNFPSDRVPLADDAHVTSSSSFSSGGQTSVFLEYYSKESVDDLEAFYKDELAAAGYSESLTSTADGEVYLYYAEATDSASGVTVTIADSEVEDYNHVIIAATSVETEQ